MTKEPSPAAPEWEPNPNPMEPQATEPTNLPVPISPKSAAGKPPVRVPFYTEEQVRDALLEADGAHSKAARLLGCSRSTIDNYVKRYPDTLGRIEAQVFQARRDMAKAVVQRGLASSNLGLALQAAKMQLKNDPDYGDKAGVTAVNTTVTSDRISVSVLKISADDQSVL